MYRCPAKAGLAACQAIVWLLCTTVNQVQERRFTSPWPAVWMAPSKQGLHLHLAMSVAISMHPRMQTLTNLWYELNKEFAWTPQLALPLDSELGEVQCPEESMKKSCKHV